MSKQQQERTRLTVPQARELAEAVVRADASTTWHGVAPMPFGRAEAACAYLRWWAESTS